MTSQGLSARRAAVALLDGVLGDGRLLSRMTGAKGPLARVAPEDRARAQRLAAQTLRMLDRADRMLGPHLRKRPPLAVHNILRLSVVELCANGEAAHGVVNSAVELTRAGRRNAKFAGLVNAVLRKVADAGPAAWAKLPPPRLPKWLRKPLLADYGKAAVEAMESAHAAGAPLDLTPKDGDAEALARQVGGEILPTGSVRLHKAAQVTALPGYDAGDWWVQDAAAALPARALAAQPGETVLDLCAAPGGKTMQLSSTGAAVTALDISARRMERVEENLVRTGLAAAIVVADALDWRGGPFDAILLDAPCSATGTIRRHPDLPHARDGSDFPALFSLQERLIDQALTLLRSGGRLVYCTCSLLPDEGEIQIEDALKRHPGLTVEPGALTLPGVEPGWRTPEGGVRLRPDYWADRGGMDGFYIACLRRP